MDLVVFCKPCAICRGVEAAALVLVDKQSTDDEID